MGACWDFPKLNKIKFFSQASLTDLKGVLCVVDEKFPVYIWDLSCSVSCRCWREWRHYRRRFQSIDFHWNILLMNSIKFFTWNLDIFKPLRITQKFYHKNDYEKKKIFSWNLTCYKFHDAFSLIHNIINPHKFGPIFVYLFPHGYLHVTRQHSKNANNFQFSC